MRWKTVDEVIDYYKELIAEVQYNGEPSELYDPINYIMSLGGKRLRPVLVGLGNDLFGGNPKEADSIAKSIEIFHNFTLLHDDIMDKAPLRRGMATVHEKWNDNIAILSGDVMLIKVYEEILKGEYSNTIELVKILNQTAIEVCEGQQLDMNFETQDYVEVDEYINMIKLKTSVLLGAALKMGAVSAGAKDKEAEKLYEFGVNLGIGFQLMDDYLDAFGDPEKFGKQVGGDILSNKKTYLNLTALKKDTTGDAKLWLSKTNFDPNEKIEAVLSIYKKLGIDESCKRLMNDYYEKAFNQLKEIDVSSEKKEIIYNFATWITNRNH